MILVAGGSGRLGSVVVQRLHTRGLDVRVLTRNPANAAHLAGLAEVVTGDVRDRESLTAAVDGSDVVVSAVHGMIGPRGISPRTVDREGNANLVDATAAAGGQFVLLSIVGASPDAAMELFRMKYAAEQHALATVPTTVVRATAFLELWIELLRQTAGRSGRPLVFGRGDNPVNLVSVEDVAAVVELAVTDPSTRGTTLEIGGPENLTFNELARAVGAADGHDRGARHVPPAALRLMAATAGRLKPQLGRQARSSLVLDSADMTFDAGPIHRRYPALPCTRAADVLGARPAPS